MNKRQKVVVGWLFAAGCLLAGCASKSAHEVESFAPGLGEIMTHTSTRHAKLWFAGSARDWKLAAYEVDELREGLEDAGKFHPTHKSSSTALPQLIAATMDAPMRELEQKVNARNFAQFQRSFDELTAACNACHVASNFGFNVFIRPALNPFSNQSFVPES